MTEQREADEGQDLPDQWVIQRHEPLSAASTNEVRYGKTSLVPVIRAQLDARGIPYEINDRGDLTVRRSDLKPPARD